MTTRLSTEYSAAKLNLSNKFDEVERRYNTSMNIVSCSAVCLTAGIAISLIAIPALATSNLIALSSSIIGISALTGVFVGFFQSNDQSRFLSNIRNGLILVTFVSAMVLIYAKAKLCISSGLSILKSISSAIVFNKVTYIASSLIISILFIFRKRKSQKLDQMTQLINQSDDIIIWLEKEIERHLAEKKVLKENCRIIQESNNINAGRYRELYDSTQEYKQQIADLDQKIKNMELEKLTLVKNTENIKKENAKLKSSGANTEKMLYLIDSNRKLIAEISDVKNKLTTIDKKIQSISAVGLEDVDSDTSKAIESDASGKYKLQIEDLESKLALTRIQNRELESDLKSLRDKMLIVDRKNQELLRDVENLSELVKKLEQENHDFRKKKK